MNFATWKDEYINIEEKLQYTFTNKSLLIEAITHSTYAYEHRSEGIESNQRLEFLGDGILDFVVGEALYMRKPEWDEGLLSKSRSLVVCERTLAQQAEHLNIGEYLLLGKGEEGTGGRKKVSTLADTMESLFAAIYLDGGFASAKKVILSQLSTYIDQAASGSLIFDYKSKLLEKAQEKHHTHEVVFQVVEEKGPVHDRVFVVAVLLDGEEFTRSEGRSKKEAEQSASQLALSKWNNGIT